MINIKKISNYFKGLSVKFKKKEDVDISIPDDVEAEIINTNAYHKFPYDLRGSLSSIIIGMKVSINNDSTRKQYKNFISVLNAYHIKYITNTYKDTTYIFMNSNVNDLDKIVFLISQFPGCGIYSEDNIFVSRLRDLIITLPVDGFKLCVDLVVSSSDFAYDNNYNYDDKNRTYFRDFNTTIKTNLTTGIYIIEIDDTINMIQECDLYQDIKDEDVFSIPDLFSLSSSVSIIKSDYEGTIIDRFTKNSTSITINHASEYGEDSIIKMPTSKLLISLDEEGLVSKLEEIENNMYNRFGNYSILRDSGNLFLFPLYTYDSNDEKEDEDEESYDDYYRDIDETIS